MSDLASAEMDEWEIDRTVEWVSRNGFRRVVLQFPDDLLGASVPLAAALQRSLDAREECGPSRVFVLADTSQNPLCVDEVAAAHVDADAAVHYGRSDLSPVTRLPTLLVFGRERVDAGAVARAIAACAAEGGPSSHPVAFVDQPLVHATEAIVAELRVLGSDGTVSFATVAATELWPAPGTGVTGCCRGGSEGCVSGAEPKEAGCSHDGRGQVQGPGDGEGEGTEAPACVAGYSLPRPDRDMEGVSLVWVGEEGPALTQLQMTLHRSRWTRVDASGATHAADMGAVQRAVGARYFLIDKARDANIVGVLVGTLGVAGFRHVVGRVRALAAGAGKKAYTVLVGKPNPAKLANFPEIDVWVMVSSPQGMILDAKEYFSKIITPFEAEIAWGDREWTGEYRLDHGESMLGYQGEAATAGKAVDLSDLGMGRFDRASDDEGADEEGGGVDGASGSARGDGAESDPGTALALGADRALSLRGQGPGAVAKTAAEFFHAKRSYWGLETPSTGAPDKPVEKAAEGLSGRAAGYATEPHT